MRSFLSALALVLAPLALASAAQAGDMTPAHAHGIELNGVTGVAYYTVESGQYHVVAVLAAEGGNTPVRVSAMLNPGQSFTISVPGAVGEREAVIEIVRQGDAVAVSPAVVALN
jgi:hypothetical protein